MQHGYLSLCKIRNILATLNDIKNRPMVLDKNIGFVSVPISRTLSWEQDTRVTATSMIQWAIKAHRLVVQTKVDNYKNDRIIVPSDLNIDNWKILMKNHPDNVLVQYLEYGFLLDINKQKLIYK